jgi:inhibitor of cysteine peptidase
MILPRLVWEALTTPKRTCILQSRSVLIFATAAFQLALYTMIMTPFCSAISSDLVPTTVTEKENGQKVLVPLDSVLEVKLETKLGTGSSWKVVEFNAGLLEFLGDSVVKPSGEKLVGTKEHHLFRFRAKAKGITALKMYYYRQWEKDVPPLKTYEIKLQIN